jgi:hypothetical protein
MTHNHRYGDTPREVVVRVTAGDRMMAAWDVPGDHMSLVREPHASALARAMRACLAG